MDLRLIVVSTWWAYGGFLADGGLRRFMLVDYDSLMVDNTLCLIVASFMEKRSVCFIYVSMWFIVGFHLRFMAN